MKKHPGMVNSLTQNCHHCLWFPQSRITFAFTLIFEVNLIVKFCDYYSLAYLSCMIVQDSLEYLLFCVGLNFQRTRTAGGGPKMKVASKWIEKWRDGEVFKAAGRAAGARMEECILSVQTPEEGFEANHIQLALDARMSGGSIEPSFRSHTAEKSMELCRCY